MSSSTVDILLVEDDRRLADLTAEYFEQNGLVVAIESRGDQALARFAKAKPRVVLLDLMLPGVDGLTICRELREIFDGPILIFTARDSDIDQVIGVLEGIAAANEEVCTQPAPRVRLRRFSDSSLDFELLCWIDRPVDRGRLLHELNCAVYKTFAAEGIEIPFPQRDLHVRSMPPAPESAG